MSAGEVSAGVPPHAPGQVATEAASIIPSVAREADMGIGATQKLFFIVAAVAIASVLGFVLYRVLHKSGATVDATASPPAVTIAGARSIKRFDAEPPSDDAGKSAADPRAATTVPALKGSWGNEAEDDPIGVRANGAASQAGSRAGSGSATVVGQPKSNPLDAPILLTQPARAGGPLGRTGVGVGASADAQRARGAESTAEFVSQTRDQLAQYKQELLDRQSALRAASAVAAQAPGPMLVAAGQSAPLSGVVGATGASSGATNPGTAGDGSLRGAATTRVRAGVLGDRSLTLPKGSSFTCALKTRVISAQAGPVGCTLMRDVFSDNGRVLLLPRGSHLDGEYKVTQVRPGSTRIPVLWTRVRTPEGITVELDSPATGPLGESGADAYVDNRWGERIGAALLVSLIEDSVNVLVNNATAPSSGNGTVVLQGTAQTAGKMAEKVLDATINMPPLLYQNQGGIVGVYTAHDIDFASVYALEPVAQ